MDYPFPRFRNVNRDLYAGFGLDESMVTLATSTDDVEAKRELSRVLTDHLLDRRMREKQGESHLVGFKKALANTAIATLALNMLGACTFADAPAPGELLRLFAVLLNQEVPANDQLHDRLKQREALIYMAQNPDASSRAVARAVGVAPGTIQAWNRTLGFREDVNNLRTFLERHPGAVVLP